MDITPNKSAMMLSIIVPCYNEEEVLPAFLERSLKAARMLNGRFEIIFIDDGSLDKTWAFIEHSAETIAEVKAIRLLRNHGHQLALSAGLKAAQGEMILAIDADLQDPPELLSEMISLMKTENADVVYGKRQRRKGESGFKRLTAFLFYRILRILTKVDIPPDTGDFRLMTREFTDILNSMPEKHRFIRGMVAWIGGRQIPFYYDRDPRFAGETKYPLRKMLQFAMDAIISFSRQPLIFANYIGIIMGVSSLILGFWSLFSYFYYDTVAGWASLITIITFQFALVFFSIGMIGIYVGRIFEINQQRPLYIIRTKVGIKPIDPSKNARGASLKEESKHA